MNIKQKREIEKEIGLGRDRTTRGRYNMRKPRKGFGLKDGSRIGLKSGGRGKNRTSTCRHPKIKKSRR
jgi:hypothetical protein